MSQECCRGQDRPCRYLARLTLRDPDQKQGLSSNFSVSSVPSHLLAKSTLCHEQKTKKSCRGAGLPALV